jgi:alpha-soluble NSF attachment protein
LKNAVELFTGEGRFAIAAKNQREIAEIYEADLDFEKAILAYQVAADYFDTENSTSQANTCLLKVAQYSAQLENYQRLIRQGVRNRIGSRRRMEIVGTEGDTPVDEIFVTP